MNLPDALQFYSEGASQFLGQILHLSYRSSWWMLIGISLLVWALEILRPWRKDQLPFRKDFGLDAFYMFFNYFLAPWLFLNFIYLFGQELLGRHLSALPSFNLSRVPSWSQILIIFFVQDFCHYWIHRLLHRFPFLWKYHKVHHSVEEMGFAAHLRYHWMENVIYRSLGSIPFFLLGFSPLDLFWVHLFTLLIGHLNHANLEWNYGPLKWILNHPAMHLWHHAEKIPQGRQYGVNYGISLSLWDLIFKTGIWAHPPSDLKLGFKDRNKFPDSFLGQNLSPLGPSSLSEAPRV